MTTDPTYGYTLDDLTTVCTPPVPPDFHAFWGETYQQVLAIPTRKSIRQIASTFPGMDIFEVEFDSLESVRIGGWLTVPSDGSFERGVVVGHGYGGREWPDAVVPGPSAAAIFPCARGFHRSAHPTIPGEGWAHVLHGIGRRETYSHRGSVADLWSAATALLEWFPQVTNWLDYSGGSFGGGVGALALPWDKRLGRAFLDVPSFGNHPLRVTLPCTGSGESVRMYQQIHPEVMEVLAYFDAAVAARFIEIPVLVAAALADPAVPPPGQFSVYKALGGEKELFVRRTGHPNLVEDDLILLDRLNEWFKSSR